MECAWEHALSHYLGLFLATSLHHYGCGHVMCGAFGGQNGGVVKKNGKQLFILVALDFRIFFPLSPGNHISADVISDFPGRKMGKRKLSQREAFFPPPSALD